MPAQAANVMGAFAGQVRVEIQEDNGFEIEEGIHGEHSNHRAEQKSGAVTGGVVHPSGDRTGWPTERIRW